MIKTGLSVEYQIRSAEFGVLSGVRKPRHTALGTQYCKGFTLLELIVVICIISILIGLFLKKVPLNQELAEKAAMEQTAAAMQSILVMRCGSLMVRGAATEKELGALTTDNPIMWLQQKPRNYAGEFFDPTPQTVMPGSWMFDLKTRDLIYVLDRGDNFTPGKSGQKWIRFHVRLQYEPRIGGVAGEKQELTSTLFEPTEPYRWFN